MSKTVKGRVQTVSDKEDDDYFGICIDDEWYNGPGSLQKNLEEAEIELQIDDNEESFIDIEEIDIIEEDSEGVEQDAGSDDPMGGASSNGSKTSSTSKPQMSERQANIMANSATKMAVEDAETRYSDDKAKHIEEVDERSQAYQNIMKDRLRENL